MYQSYSAVKPYVTKDGSEIRELMHPSVQGNAAQSLAEATVSAGEKTLLHCHHRTEELYHIRSGEGMMTLGREQFRVQKGNPLHPSRNTSLHRSGRKCLARSALLLLAGL